MGMKHKIYSALYVIKGSINHQLAGKTGFSDEDAEKIKEALRTLFVKDSSSRKHLAKTPNIDPLLTGCSGISILIFILQCFLHVGIAFRPVQFIGKT